jgi:hypothetical protein
MQRVNFKKLLSGASFPYSLDQSNFHIRQLNE